jgi:hypothetical protein
MAVRVTWEVLFSISSTTADEKDLGNFQQKVRTDANEEGGAWKTIVASAAVDELIQLDNIATARFLVLKINNKGENDPAPEITVKFNNIANTPLTIKPPADKKIGMLVVTTDNLTALYVSNAGSYDAELTVAVAGD